MNPPPIRQLILVALTASIFSLTAAAAPLIPATPYTGQTPGTKPGDGGVGRPSNAGSGNTPEGLLGSPKEEFFSGSSLTGDWGGVRDHLEDNGIKLTPIYTGEIFGNTGGTRQGFIFDGVFNLALDLDLDRITHDVWRDAAIHANALYIYGQSLSGKYIGDFSNTSNIAGYNSVRLQELWLEQNLWDKRVSVRAGMLAADTEFFTSDSAGLFINGTFGAFTLIGANFYDAPIYPISSPGVRINVQPISHVYLRAAVFGSDAASDSAENNQHGTHFHVNESAGALLMFELGYLVNQSPNDRGLVGSYKLGSIIQRGNYPSFRSQADDALGEGRLSGKNTNYAVYGIADQELYKAGGQIISAFVRAGFAPSEVSFVDRYVDCGFNFKGFLPNRPSDVGGIAFAYSNVSRDFSRADVRQGNGFDTGEAVVELTYRINFADWFSLQPDVQYVVNPSGVAHSNDAWAFGLRTTVTF